MILVIVDSKKYARTNCFVSQLVEAMIQQAHSRNESIFFVELNQFLEQDCWKLIDSGQTRIIFVCRQRIFHRFLQNFGSSNPLGDLPVFVYEQDPWQAYIRESESLGFFKELKAKLNIQNVYLTSQWWSKFVAEQEGIDTSFVRMWMSPRYCRQGENIKSRKIKVGFKGTMHGHRLEFFKELSKLGVDVSIDAKRLRYKAYLKWLSQVGIFIHDESKTFPTVFGNIPMSTALWAKDIETASRGAFTIRNAFESEASTYFVEKIPSIFLFKEIQEVPQLLQFIYEKSDEELGHIAEDSVSFIKNSNLWAQTANQLMGLS